MSRKLSDILPAFVRRLVDVDWLGAFGAHLWRHFREDRCFEAAGALSYTSLLALVPLMAVTLGVISAFPVFDQWASALQDFIFENFVPAAGDMVQRYLQQFVGNTAGLTGAGTVFLIVTALLLMSTIEKSFNRIWRVQTPRRLVSRLVMYWAALTLGPLLMGASLALTSYLAALPLFSVSWVPGVSQSVLLTLAPFVVSLAAFTLVFMIVPNRRVAFRHALAGALVSAVLFEITKRGFVWYVTGFPTYEKLYGALATVPLFLVWIYVSWVVILLGGSVAAALTTFSFRRADWRWQSRHELVLALRLLGHLWAAQRVGVTLSSAELLAREPAVTDAQLQRLLGDLDRARLVGQADNGDWMLAADLAEVPMSSLYRASDFVLPLGELDDIPADRAGDEALMESLQTIDNAGGPMLERPIKSYLRPNREHP